MPEPEPLDPHEAAALRRTLRELGQLGRYDEIAADFAKRGPAALIELGNDGRFDAEDVFNRHYMALALAEARRA
jgi:hypothetical protein